jgi:REP element-mobilizing transposase RayT
LPVGDDTFAYRRDLPHLLKDGKTLFVTFCTRNRMILSSSERTIVLDCCIHDHRITFSLLAAVIMPDHVHLLISKHEDWTMAAIMRRIKGVSARQINKQRGTNGHIWQREWFDRMLRSDEDERAKGSYICANPVRSGLVDSIEGYAWKWRYWIEGAAE